MIDSRLICNKYVEIMFNEEGHSIHIYVTANKKEALEVARQLREDADEIERLVGDFEDE